jgi:hypothetical protein
MTAGLLSRPTLVLNRNWQPVGIATVSRTLVKLWNGTARVVDPNDYQIYSWSDWSALRPDDDEPFIQTTSLRLRVPEVITLTKYDRVPNRSVAFSRRNLFKRDKFTCQYCMVRPGSDHAAARQPGRTASLPVSTATHARPTEVPRRLRCRCEMIRHSRNGSRFTRPSESASTVGQNSSVRSTGTSNSNPERFGVLTLLLNTSRPFSWFLCRSRNAERPMFPW